MKNKPDTTEMQLRSAAPPSSSGVVVTADRPPEPADSAPTLAVCLAPGWFYFSVLYFFIFTF
jgi:hypothetical protein